MLNLFRNSSNFLIKNISIFCNIDILFNLLLQTWSNSTSNSTENDVNKPKKDENLLLKVFYEEFIKSELNSDKKEDFLRDVLDNNDISDDLKRKIDAFIWKNEDFNLLGWKINFQKLKTMLSKELISLDTKRKELNKLFLSSYEINKWDAKKLEWAILKLSTIELDKTLNNQKEQKKLLAKIYWAKKIPRDLDVLSFFKKFNFTQRCNDKLADNNTSNEAKEDIRNIMIGFSIHSLTIADLISLFEHNIFSKEEKIQLARVFLPVITLEDAEKIGLWLDSKQVKFDAIKNTPYFSKLSKSDIESLLNAISSRDINISINSINLESNIDLFCTEALPTAIASKIKQWVDENKKELLDRSPKSLDEFKLTFDNNEKLKLAINKITDGSFIQIKLKSEWNKSKETIIWIRVIKTDINNIWIDLENWLNLELFSWEEYWSKIEYNKSKEENRSYRSLLNFFNNWNISQFDVFSKEETNDKEKWWNIKINVNESDPKFLNEDDIENQQNVLDKKITELEEKKLNNTNTQEDDLELEALYTDQERLKEFNLFELKEKIDELDPEWISNWFDVWTTFYVDWKNKNDWIWTVAAIDIIWQKITLDNHLRQELTFLEFFTWFKELEAKRSESIDWFSWLIDALKTDSNIWDDWSKFEFDWNNIVNKINKDAQWYKHIEYLVWDETTKFIKILSIDGEFVTIQWWEIEEGWENKKTRKKTNDLYTLWSKETISLSKLNFFIKQNKLKEKDDFVPKLTDENRTWSFWTNLFNNKSFYDLIASWKIIVDSFENYFKEWSADNAARMANWMFSWVLPHELKHDLKARVQWEEKKRTDEYVEKLKKLDSWEATELIRRRLLNSNSPQYKIEAWIIFMFEWYWSIYTKKLSPYMWSWLWYRALWWQVWDDIWKKAEIEAKDPKTWQSTNATEEYAVFLLIKKQCWWDWYKWIKRRTRLHKELKAMWPQWVEAEIEKWMKDWKDTRSVVNMMKSANDEVKDGTFACWYWWMKRMASRWGHMEDVWSTPIISMFSWISNYWDQRLTIQMKDIYKVSNPDASAIPMFEFMWSREWPQQLSEIIVDLSKELDDAYWYNGEMYSDAKEILADRNKSSTRPEFEAEKFDKAVKFWKTYWTILSRALHTTNGGDIKYTKAENLLYLVKDKPWNERLAKYYSKLRNEISAMFSFVNQGYMKDWLEWVWITWMNLHEAIGQAFELQNYTFKHTKIVKGVWKEVLQSISCVKNSDMSDEEKRKILTLKFTDLLAWIYKAWKDGRQLNNILWLELNEIKDWIKDLWFDFIHHNKVLEGDPSDKAILKSIEWNNAINDLIVSKVDKYLSWWSIWSANDEVSSILDWKVTTPKNSKINDTMHTNASNILDIMNKDDDYLFDDIDLAA